MLSALFGFVGVLVGAAVAWLGQLELQRRQEFRTAQRLAAELTEAFLEARVAVIAVLEDDDDLDAEALLQLRDLWRASRGVLTQHLTRDDLGTVRSATFGLTEMARLADSTGDQLRHLEGWESVARGTLETTDPAIAALGWVVVQPTGLRGYTHRLGHWMRGLPPPLESRPARPGEQPRG